MKRKYNLLLIIFILLMSIFPSSLSAKDNSSKGNLTILEKLGFSNYTIISNNCKGDILVQNPKEEIWMDDISYALINENDEIVRINRIDEVNHCYSSGELLESQFQTSEELETYLENELIGDDYFLYEKYDFDDNTVSLRYVKKINNGYDMYDYFLIFIDKNFNIVESLYKSQSNFVESDNKVLNIEDILIKNDFCEISCLDDYSYSLMTFKTNQYCESVYQNKGIVLTYQVIRNNEIYYFDAYNGQIVFKDMYEALGGTIATSDTDLSYAANRVKTANSMLISMGYTNSTYLISTNFSTDMGSKLNCGFYAVGHANTSCIGSNVTSNYFNASQVTSKSYKFVFLDGCSTYSTTWTNAFGIYSTSSNKAFIGFSSTVTAYNAYIFCGFFWGYVGSSTPIRSAVITAASYTASSLPVSFKGDVSYNGYY